MITDFNESDCENWDDGKFSTHTMINILIIKIRELINEINTLQKNQEVKGN